MLAKAMIWQCFAILVAAYSYIRPGSSSDPTVNLGYSNFAGTRLLNNVDEFIGMRYAAAPLGDLRFRAPQAPPEVQGVQKANKFGDYCIGTNEKEGDVISEDCLFVNVWRPSNATQHSKLPVWVFIQGGGFNLNYSPNYNGSEVVETSGNNIIMVNFNWRVGLYGFLAGQTVQSYGDLNAGLLDQLALLQWVQDYISKFGGDPSHVVIHGSSAGAGSVALHLLNPKAKHLYAGAILESTFMPTQPHKSELEWQYERLIQDVNCAVGTQELEMQCLRRKTTGQLQKGNIASPFPGREYGAAPVWYWTPCIDGNVVPDQPLRMYQRRQFTNVPMMIGNNKNEGAYFAANASTADEVRNFIKDNYPKISNDEVRDVTDYYPEAKPVPQHATWFPSSEQAYGESTFTCPAIAILDAVESVSRSRGGNCTSEVRLWSYHMNVHDDDYIALGLGCPHGYEEGMIFGPANTNIEGRYQPPKSFSTYNAPLIPVVMNYWISFIRSLNPNTYSASGAPIWKTWSSGQGESRLLIRLGELAMEPVPEAQVARCDFWNRVDRSLLH